jgi:hypothetical protein
MEARLSSRSMIQFVGVTHTLHPALGAHPGLHPWSQGASIQGSQFTPTPMRGGAAWAVPEGLTPYI